ncbi:MAG TPA: hypothetical protein VMC09_09050 [Anaerolineales bacterium]|nr:hypothetical protein [Anaerolineales bacterium]
MSQTPIPPLPSPAPQKTNPWIIVIAILVVVCCGCFGAVGLLLAFGKPILDELGLSFHLIPIFFAAV